MIGPGAVLLLLVYDCLSPCVLVKRHVQRCVILFSNTRDSQKPILCIHNHYTICVCPKSGFFVLLSFTGDLWGMLVTYLLVCPIMLLLFCSIIYNVTTLSYKIVLMLPDTISPPQRILGERHILRRTDVQVCTELQQFPAGNVHSSNVAH